MTPLPRGSWSAGTSGTSTSGPGPAGTIKKHKMFASTRKAALLITYHRQGAERYGKRPGLRAARQRPSPSTSTTNNCSKLRRPSCRRSLWGSHSPKPTSKRRRSMMASLRPSCSSCNAHARTLQYTVFAQKHARTGHVWATGPGQAHPAWLCLPRLSDLSAGGPNPSWPASWEAAGTHAGLTDQRCSQDENDRSRAHQASARTLGLGGRACTLILSGSWLAVYIF